MSIRKNLRSSRLYVRLPAPQTRMFRYLLEAEDNLAYTSVVDRKIALLKICFTPEQETEVRRVLAGIAESLPCAVLEAPLSPSKVPAKRPG